MPKPPVYLISLRGKYRNGAATPLNITTLSPRATSIIETASAVGFRRLTFDGPVKSLVLQFRSPTALAMGAKGGSFIAYHSNS